MADETCESIGAKHEALAFLQDLERTLNSTLPGPADMESCVRRTVAAAKTDDKQKHLRLPEAAFLNKKVIPAVSEMIQSYSGLSKDQARLALLNESHRSMPDFSCYSPIRWERHPFKKEMVGVSATDIYKAWADHEKGHGLTQSCPDFSLRNPFPHSILFEGKYFPRRSGSLEYAQRQLVDLAYQAFFYLGLPRLAATKKHPKWGYDYSCLLAYDASEKGTLISAWTTLHPRMRRGFWDGANVYVMILRGMAEAEV